MSLRSARWPRVSFAPITIALFSASCASAARSAAPTPHGADVTWLDISRAETVLRVENDRPKSLAAAPDGTIFVSMFSGALYRSAPAGEKPWEQVATRGPTSLLSMYAPSRRTVFGIANGALSILRWSEHGGFRPENLPIVGGAPFPHWCTETNTVGRLIAIGGKSETAVFAVGHHAFTYHYDGSRWDADPNILASFGLFCDEDPHNTLVAVCANDAGVYAAGARILRTSGDGRWLPVSLPAPRTKEDPVDVTAIARQDSSLVFAVRAWSTTDSIEPVFRLLRLAPDGRSWTELASYAPPTWFGAPRAPAQTEGPAVFWNEQSASAIVVAHDRARLYRLQAAGQSPEIRGAVVVGDALYFAEGRDMQAIVKDVADYAMIVRVSLDAVRPPPTPVTSSVAPVTTTPPKRPLTIHELATAESLFIARAPSCSFPPVFDTTTWKRFHFKGDVSFLVPPWFQTSPPDRRMDSTAGDWTFRDGYAMWRKSYAPRPRAFGNGSTVGACVTSKPGSRLLVLVSRDTISHAPTVLVLPAAENKLRPEWTNWLEEPWLMVRPATPGDVGIAMTMIQSMTWPPPPGPPPRPAASAGCRSDEGEAISFLEGLRDLSTDTSRQAVAERSRAGLSALGDTALVEQITQGPLCARAAAAFDSYISAADSAHRDPARRVYLYRYGRNFVVGDPFVRAGEWFPMVVFDAEFKQVGGITF